MRDSRFPTVIGEKTDYGLKLRLGAHLIVVEAFFRLVCHKPFHQLRLASCQEIIRRVRQSTSGTISHM